MANNFKIGSFNACNLSNNSSTDKLSYIAEIIKNENFDIIGIQEVLHEGKMWGGASVESEINSRFLKYNLPGWECRYCRPSRENSRTEDRRREGFFLIWKNDSFHLAEYKSINDKEKRVFEPRIINELSNDTPKALPPMARMPMYARFVANSNSSIELRIINVHFYNGIGQLGYSGRQEEFWATINEIYSGIQGRGYGSGVKPYTIVLGDYNLIINDALAYDPYGLNRYTPYIHMININSDGNRIITTQTEPTSLRDPRTDEYGQEKMPDDPYLNNFDHFSYDLDRFESTDVNVSVRRMTIEDCIKHSPRKFDTKALEYAKIISDHVPIIMEISF